MRLLGTDTPLRQFELEFLSVAARCKAHSDPRIQDIGTDILTERKNIRDYRLSLEELEDLLTLAQADTQMKNYTRGRTLISLGAYVKAKEPTLRDSLFRLTPSKILQLGYDKETEEIELIILNLQRLPTNHSIRVEYEARLIKENDAFKNVREQQRELQFKQAYTRQQTLQMKLQWDRFREQKYALCIQVVTKQESEELWMVSSSLHRTDNSVEDKRKKKKDTPSPVPTPTPSE